MYSVPLGQLKWRTTIMKRAVSIILIIVLLFLSSCNTDEPGVSGEPATTSPDFIPSESAGRIDTDTAESSVYPESGSENTDFPVEPVDPIDYYEDPIGYLRKNMPIIDGSTSLIPLEGGVKAAIYGVSQEEGEKMVYHTTTYGSFYNLLDGSCDIILSVPLSEDQYKSARERGIELEEVPIAKEGFVFVVNYNNPVDTLTQQQLRDIYSGKITSWKEVGGRDEEIIAYQRNWDSGSQNYMITFMGDTPLMEAPKEKMPATMSGLMDVIAVNENAENSIGYSVYAYAADMYGTGKDVKFIKVDGVEPNKETMASGEYPLMSYNYAIFRANEPEDSPVRRLVEWMTSYEGQLAIAKAGYITVRDIGFDYEEMTMNHWSGTGTGIPKPKSYTIPTCEYAPYLDYRWYAVPVKEVKPENAAGLTKGVRFELDCLTDRKLQDEINKWIAGAMVRADENADEFEKFVENLNKSTSYAWYLYSDIRNRSSMISKDEYHPSATCLVTAKNGYLSVTVAMAYTWGVMDGYQRIYHAETGVWDLLTGKKLDISDLFYSGVDIDKVVNDYLRRVSQEPIDSWGDYYEMKRDFAGLTTTGWTMTADTIYILQDNPYFAYGVAFDFDLPDGYLASEQPRDMSACFDPAKVPVIRFFRRTDKNAEYRYSEDGFMTCEFLKEGSYPTAGEINSKIMEITKEYFTEEKVYGYFRELGIPDEHIYFFDPSWWMEEYVGKFVEFTCWLDSVSYNNESHSYPYYTQPIFFDLQTGDYLDWKTLVDSGWLKGHKQEIDKLKDMVLIDVGFDNDFITLTFEERGNRFGETRTLRIPPEHINW